MKKNPGAINGKRKGDRFNVYFPLQLTVVENKVPQYSVVGSSLLNLSEGGAYVRAMEKIAEGQEVLMDFTLPLDNMDKYDINKLRVNLEGQVIRTEESGFAVKFAETFRVIAT
jgi:hypothetical protein